MHAKLVTLLLAVGKLREGKEKRCKLKKLIDTRWKFKLPFFKFDLEKTWISFGLLKRLLENIRKCKTYRICRIPETVNDTLVPENSLNFLACSFIKCYRIPSLLSSNFLVASCTFLRENFLSHRRFLQQPSTTDPALSTMPPVCGWKMSP